MEKQTDGLYNRKVRYVRQHFALVGLEMSNEVPLDVRW